jgi:hypothetical protein
VFHKGFNNSNTVLLTLLVPYTSNIGTCIEALPIHVQRLVIDIPAMRTPVGWYPKTPVNIIIATYRYVTFGVGYHSWVIAMEDEDILLQGGGPDVNTSGKAGAQIPHPPLGDDSSPWGR